MIRSLRTKGFTLVEIMIVVAIIGILIAIAVPGFLRARENSRQKACWETQHKIDGAVQQYILDKNVVDQATAVATLTPTSSELVGDDKYIRFEPECPSNGTYSLVDTGFAVECDINEGDEFDHDVPGSTAGGGAGT